MHILIKFPSRSRPDKLRSVFLKYVQMAENTSQISFLVSLDEDDPTVTRSQQIVLKRVHPDTQIIVGPPLGKIGAVNRDMEHAPPFDILLLASDDMIPSVRGYDQIIRENMQKHYPDTDGVLHFNDGVRGNNLNTLCILGKKYYDRFGYIYHPSYKSLWCDNEFTDVSNKLHKSTYIDMVIIRHEHPLWTKTGYDDLYKHNDTYDTQDKINYNARKDQHQQEHNKVSKLIQVYTRQTNVVLSSEQLILFGLLQKSNDDRFNDQFIEFCRTKFAYVNTPEECDIIVLPFKFNGIADSTYINLCSISKHLHKPLLCFYNDDDDTVYDIPSHVILFRTSFYTRSRLKNEYAMPAFTTDYFKHKYLTENTLIIGYCGHVLHGRDVYIRAIMKSDIKHAFIIRNGFRAPGVDSAVAIQDYVSNMENALFIFCYRGAGNFSYRFYETLMMGRIPILINTDCVFPFDSKVDIRDIACVIDEQTLKSPNDIIGHITTYYTANQHRILDMQKNNRKVWEQYFSPSGFVNNIYEIFKK